MVRRRGATPGQGYVDAARLSVLVVSALEGALLLARVKRSVAPMREVAEALDDVLGRPR